MLATDGGRIARGKRLVKRLIEQRVDVLVLSGALAIGAAGLDADFFPQPGLNHYEAVYGLADPASPLSQAVAEFMKRCG